jgi:hypothetical protein
MRGRETAKGDQKTEVEDKKDVFVASMTGMRGRRGRECV